MRTCRWRRVCIWRCAHFLDNETLDAHDDPLLAGDAQYFRPMALPGQSRGWRKKAGPSACEGDADGALSAWIGESLGLGRCYLSDWLEHDRETITLWHGGAAPMSLCEPIGEPGGPRIARHFNIKKPAVVEATLRADMPITILRFWRLDGNYFFTAREGETIKPKRHLMGTNGLARMKDRPAGMVRGDVPCRACRITSP